MAITLTQNNRNQVIVNATDKASGLQASVRLDLILGLVANNPGTTIITSFKDFTVSESKDEVVAAIGWDQPLK